ncbi:MAG: LysR substrate-binding domain-containing protein [Labrys sp. (in: a-proteobacteria)]|jgi:DNA-binding transcriptional LysR family regulator
MGRRSAQHTVSVQAEAADGHDWNALQSFAAVVRHGSLSKAARELRRSQPTLGRHIEQIETMLGHPVFERGRQGLALAGDSDGVADKAERLLSASEAALRSLTELAEQPAGPVMVATWSLVAKVALPDVLDHLSARYPRIQLNHSFIRGIDDEIEDDIDIAIRCFPPRSGDFIQRRVTSIRSAFYALPALVMTVPSVRTREDVYALPFVVPKCEEPVRTVVAAAGFDIGRLNFALRSDADDVIAAAMLKGVGVGLMPMIVRPESLGLMRVLPEFHIDFPCYLVASSRMRRSRRIRAVFDYLADALPTLLS